MIQHRRMMTDSSPSEIRAAVLAAVACGDALSDGNRLTP
jgi:hypothetical protein